MELTVHNNSLETNDGMKSPDTNNLQDSSGGFQLKFYDGLYPCECFIVVCVKKSPGYTF